MTEMPNPEAFQAFVNRSTEGPVVMLNLLKFKTDGGAEGYAAYAAATAPLLEKVGGRAKYAGRGGELLIGKEGQDWDMVLLVEYPSRQALLDMVQSPAYQEIQHLRDDSLVYSVLLSTDPLDPAGI